MATDDGGGSARDRKSEHTGTGGPRGDSAHGPGDGDRGSGSSNGSFGPFLPAAPELSPGPAGPGGGAGRLWVGDEGLIAPAVAVGNVRDKLEDVGRTLAGAIPETVWATVTTPFGPAGIFGDSEVESAWSTFHRAWTRETGVTTAAVTQVEKLLPHSENKQRETDGDGARNVRRAAPDASRTPLESLRGSDRQVPERPEPGQPLDPPGSRGKTAANG